MSTDILLLPLIARRLLLAGLLPEAGLGHRARLRPGLRLPSAALLLVGSEPPTCAGVMPCSPANTAYISVRLSPTLMLGRRQARPAGHR